MLAMAVTFFVTFAWAAVNFRRPATVLPDGSSRITPGKKSAGVVVAVAMALIGVGIWLAITAWPSGAVASAVAGGPLIAAGMLLGGFMAPSLTHLHDLVWDMNHVEGPSRIFGLTLGLQRETIAWSDFVRLGSTWTGYDFAESADGRRIYWSYLYSGHGALVRKLERAIDENEDTRSAIDEW
jgi:hypothetical protein